MLEPLNSFQRESQLIADRIAELTGDPHDLVILRALQERLQRLTAPTSEAERAHLMMTSLETSLWRNTSAPALGTTITRAQEDEILGYGPEGV